MPKIKFRITPKSLKRLTRQMSNKLAKIGKVSNEALEEIGVYIKEQSIRNTPVDTGDLVASAYTKFEADKYKPKTIVGYTSNYALYVHEDLEARHGRDRLPFVRNGTIVPPDHPNHSAKFLERVLKEKAREIFAIAEKGVKRAL